MSFTEGDTLRVPGAHLAYEVSGTGPLLLLIPGGSGNGSGYTGIGSYLADQYRVVIYDRRGAGRSTLDEPYVDASGDMSIERHSDDALALLAALTAEPAYVFGSSAGALIGLDLVTRYPDRVRLLVAHEPTVPGVLPAFDRSQEHHLETYRREGELAAISELAAENAPTDEQREAGVALSPGDLQIALTSARMLFQSTVPALLRYRPDLKAMKSARSQIVLAGSRVGRERATPVYQATVALAQRLGVGVVEFPGHHTSCVSSPGAFAARLGEVLGHVPGT